MPNIPTWSDIRKRATPSFVFIAPLVALILLAVYIRLTYTPEPVILDIDLPRTIAVTESGSMTLDATFRLNNNSEEDIGLSVLGECRVLRWYIVDRSDQIIQSAQLTDCGSDPVYEVLNTTSALVYSTQFELDATRFVAGDRYFLRVRFWGHEAQERFTVSD